MMHLALLVLILWSVMGLAQSGRGIPTKYMNDPAVDLVRNGKTLLPDDVEKLRVDSRGRFDISTLDPEESSDLWKNVYLKTLPADKNPVIDMGEINYISPILSPSGIFRFNIQNKAGDGKLYTVMLSKTVHSYLLAKNLLRKIGYQIPDIKWIPRAIVKFKDETEKKGFISQIENVSMAGGAKFWVIEDLAPDKLMVQDLVILDSNNEIYNLAVGVTSDMIQGRRLMSSLAVPLSIVNLTESVNMFRWNAGVISNSEVGLFIDQLGDFQCSWDDARWITRRIEKLSREDWKEIVDNAFLPKAVGQILVEKLISRRNSVMKMFKVDAEELKVDSDISNGVELAHGKLTTQDWPGYASRFAFGDPDSPLSGSEMKSWVKSRAISTLMDLTLGQINQISYLGTDIQALNNEKFQAEVTKATQLASANHTSVVLPLKAWVFPTYRGQLIYSRNLVTGSYLGTDNLVQLADTVGVAISGGVFAGSMGLPSPITAFGSANVSLLRTYAHLRPVTSIQKSLKYPFKNILVPLVKHDYGKLLHEAALVVLDPKASEKDRLAKIEAALKPFKDNMQIGESILITDSLASQAALQVGAGYKKLAEVGLTVSPSYKVLSRFHIHRRSADVFHVYRDLGQEASGNLAFDFDSLVPVFKVGITKSIGSARVKYYSLDLSPANPDVIKNISLLRRAIVSSSTSDLDENEATKPFVLKTTYKEQTPSASLFFWQWKGDKSSSNITVRNPKGDEKYFSRDYLGATSGVNYQAYTNEVIARWVKIIFDRKAGLTDSTGTNPGYSFKGHAVNRVLTLDQERDKEGHSIEPFIHVSRIHNGWSIDRKKAQDILEEMKARYHYEFYSAPVLNDTRRLFMYNISLNLLFYKAGIQNAINLTDLEAKKIFFENQTSKDLMISRAPIYSKDAKNTDELTQEDKDSGAFHFLLLMKKFKKFEAKGDESKANQYLLRAFSQAEKKLNLKGLTLLVGGIENLYLTSRIDGFREGDEDGDKALVSNSLGEFGSPNILGPLVQIQRQTDMLEGEFFIYWMMTRLI